MQAPNAVLQNGPRAALRRPCKRWCILLGLFLSWSAGQGVAHAASEGASGGVECHLVLGVNPSGYEEVEKCFFSMSLNGEIRRETVAKFQELLEERRRWIGDRPPPGAGNLTVDSPGGSVAAAIAIGRMLRVARIPISVRQRQRCISACVLVLAGAVERNYGGRVGIHRPYLSPPREAQQLDANDVRLGYAELLQQIRMYLREMNVSEQLANDMLAIEPADIRYLSYAELKKYGLAWHDPIEQETRDLQEAQELGLERSEYIRRQAVRKTRCELSALQRQLGHPPDLPEFEACWKRVMKSGQ